VPKWCSRYLDHHAKANPESQDGEYMYWSEDSGRIVSNALSAESCLQDLEIEHTVVLMDSEISCRRLEALLPNIGCAWTAFLQERRPQRYWSRTIHMWLLRWLLFTSCVRRGTNVLILDTDISVRMNPYAFLKSAAFASHSLVVMYDDNVPEINCGTIYGQDIAPDGPVAWITAEVVDRLLRYARFACHSLQTVDVHITTCTCACTILCLGDLPELM
jgi:hypothetical protein